MLREHTIDFRVRYQETDAQGRVHHGNYLTWFEMGRVELLRAAGYSYRTIEQQGLLLVVIEAHCQYLQPAHYDDLLSLTTRTLKCRGARIQHAYQVHRDSDLLAEGETTIASVHPDGRPRRLPDWLQLN